MRTSSVESVEQSKGEVEDGCYFYGVISSGEKTRFGDIGMDGAEVYTLPYKDISAVVSDTTVKEYEMSEDYIRRHEEVLRSVMQSFTIVPVEFNTVIHNERILRRLLKRSYNTMKECLKVVDGMVELGLKVMRKKDSVQGVKSKVTANKILEPLKGYSEQSISGDLFTDRLVLNESFLVKEDNMDPFSEVVSELEDEYHGVRLLYSGPWPPYSFVYIKIGREGIELDKKA